jgi:hypothetical protein
MEIGRMKRKPTRDIPDFSSKRPMKGQNPFQRGETAKGTKHATPAPRVKPQATSSKSGRRGS